VYFARPTIAIAKIRDYSQSKLVSSFQLSLTFTVAVAEFDDGTWAENLKKIKLSQHRFLFNFSQNADNRQRK